MLCYLGRTFCTYYADCANAEQCHRPLTDEVRAAAIKWWGDKNPPIAHFSEQPGCHSSRAPSRDDAEFPSSAQPAAAIPPSPAQDSRAACGFVSAAASRSETPLETAL